MHMDVEMAWLLTVLPWLHFPVLGVAKLGFSDLRQHLVQCCPAAPPQQQSRSGGHAASTCARSKVQATWVCNLQPMLGRTAAWCASPMQ